MSEKKPVEQRLLKLLEKRNSILAFKETEYALLLNERDIFVQSIKTSMKLEDTEKLSWKLNIPEGCFVQTEIKNEDRNPEDSVPQS